MENIQEANSTPVSSSPASPPVGATARFLNVIWRFNSTLIVPCTSRGLSIRVTRTTQHYQIAIHVYGLNPGCGKWVHVTSGYSRRLHARGSRTPEERNTSRPGNAEAQVFQKSFSGEAGAHPSNKQLTAYGHLALVRAGPPNITKTRPRSGLVTQSAA